MLLTRQGLWRIYPSTFHCNALHVHALPGAQFRGMPAQGSMELPEGIG
jgi:hypothetical protein